MYYTDIKSSKLITSKANTNIPVNAVGKVELLGTSWRHQTREFFDNSTLHGVRYIAEKGRPFCERFMWFCFTSVGAVATCIIIVSLWEKFQTNPTITGLDTDFHNWDVLFPAITVCDRAPNNPDSVDEYINNCLRCEYSLYHEILLAILKTCAFKADSEDCCELFMPMITENGFCYAFNSRHIEKTWPWLSKTLEPYLEQYIHETDTKWSFVFDSTHKDTLNNIYIHSTDEMPGMDSNPQHVWDRRVEKISFSVKQTYTTPDARQLSIKQRRCVFADEISLVTDSIYTYSACTRQCRMMLARQFCGCVPHFYPQIEKFRYCTLVELRCIAEHVDKITNIDKCNCELGCSNTVYEVEKLTEQDPTRGDDADAGDRPLEIEFVSWPMVRYKREVLFGWVDLLVSFGGIAGLFLGFSLLSGVEIIYYFTLRACCMFHRDKDELKRLNHEYSQRDRPPFDLGLKVWKKPPTASLKGAKAVLKQSATRRSNAVQPQKIVVKEASQYTRPPSYSPPPVYMEYLP
ncbi:sodium channel protein Nach-like [Arctopsyche grandis]|uniref:sodium channel protein Nach-like n=1 Tax=Arctopsyche grandis TaxID=121162 RepID=UPI00406DA4DB